MSTSNISIFPPVHSYRSISIYLFIYLFIHSTRIHICLHFFFQTSLRMDVLMDISNDSKHLRLTPQHGSSILQRQVGLFSKQDTTLTIDCVNIRGEVRPWEFRDVFFSSHLISAQDKACVCHHVSLHLSVFLPCLISSFSIFCLSMGLRHVRITYFRSFTFCPPLGTNTWFFSLSFFFFFSLSLIPAHSFKDHLQRPSRC